MSKLTTGGRIGDAEFSPEGTRIAFHKKLADGKQYWFVRNVAGGGLVKLGQGSNPSWSPDGRRLAFIDSRGVCVMPVRAGAPSVVLLANDPDEVEPVTYTDVDWARSGGRMAVTRWYYYYDEHHIVAVDEVSDRTGATQRTHSERTDPDFSRDGSALALRRNYRYGGPDEGIDVIDIATGALTQVTSWEDDRRTITPIWSPDGSRLAVRENALVYPENPVLDLRTISASDGSVLATLRPGISGRNVIPRDWRAAR